MLRVKSGKKETNKAAREFDVPATTLKDRLPVRVKHCKPGPAPYLTEEEERKLAQFFFQVARLVYGKTKQEVLDILRKTLEKKRKSILPNSKGKDGGLDSKSDTPT